MHFGKGDFKVKYVYKTKQWKGDEGDRLRHILLKYYSIVFVVDETLNGFLTICLTMLITSYYTQNIFFYIIIYIIFQKNQSLNLNFKKAPKRVPSVSCKLHDVTSKKTTQHSTVASIYLLGLLCFIVIIINSNWFTSGVSSSVHGYVNKDNVILRLENLNIIVSIEC